MVSRATNLKAPLRRSVQTTTIHFQQDPSQSNLLRVCRLGSCSQDKISTSLCLSVYGSRPPYVECTASTACGSWSNRVWWMSLPNSAHLLQMAVTWTHCKLCLLVLIKCKYPWVLILGFIVSSVVQPFFWRQWVARQQLQLYTLYADRKPLQLLVQMHHWTHGGGDKLASSHHSVSQFNPRIFTSDLSSSLLISSLILCLTMLQLVFDLRRLKPPSFMMAFALW